MAMYGQPSWRGWANTEMEYKVVHLEHHGVRWESISNLVLNI